MRLLLVLMALALGACPFRTAPPDCNAVGIVACDGQRPMRCSSDLVLRPTREPCGAGETCRVTVGVRGEPIAACGIGPSEPVTSTAGHSQSSGGSQ